MQKLVLPLLSAALLLAPLSFSTAQGAKPTAAVSKAAGDTYAVQPQLSTLGWVAKKVTGQHNGTVALKDGQLQVKGNQITGGTFTFDVAALKIEDVTNEGMNARLTTHLKSDDFFATEKFPTATFVISSLKTTKPDAAGNNAEVTGKLTIKGITQDIRFPAKVGVKDGVAAASGTATVDRTKFDIKFRSAAFFSDLGDKAIEDNFTLNFNVVAKKATRS
ncbi:YceI family protein [Hymenobacter sp. 15J16-1T3B]|uniref:YceI family protein n=1 Tax=Hymenobacter sp. 15J16-1T3B TaxID=2886941 RepID=UPI001D118460|nr:YceI family protein [Hymenobacter sp. 15J16-1T3B]MCC3160130.1 YceI family protein [Hymenobacter sp. 15J16-1T3B]